LFMCGPNEDDPAAPLPSPEWIDGREADHDHDGNSVP